MPVDIEWRPEVGKKIEDFFNDSGYKEYLESAVSFNRKLNEERKMRLPYIDGQTGVAQKHYNSQRHCRERMPGVKPGQVYCYPQKHWRKKRYQYLKYFMSPKRFDPEAEMHTISQIENPSALTTLGGGSSLPSNEDSNTSGGPTGDNSKSEWPYYDEDMFPEGEGDDPNNSDSDFEYEDSYTRRRRGAAGGSGGAGGSKKGPGKNKGGPKGGGGPGAPKRRTHADNIPDSEKPFSCERPGPGRPSRRSAAPGMSYRDEPSMGYGRDEDAPLMGQSSSTMAPHPGGPHPVGPGSPHVRKTVIVDGKERAVSLGYCDFCLGDNNENKKTGRREDMVSCAECGRSGHPTCLQFTENMIVSVRQYPWTCIECKCCTLCGTSENDDQLLFCDDCDRGYHMYCLVPPIKEPPEGSWSCNLCIERFHRK